VTEPTPPPAEPVHARPWTLHRTLRTAHSESYDVVDGETRTGTVTLQYAPETVEGVLTVPADLGADAVRGLLVWVTDLLALDAAAGPAGVIHWVVATGTSEDFWRRSPGRRATGAEHDLAAARARVESVLHAMFHDVVAMPDGGYAVDAGSVRVFVGARLLDETVAVRVFSITNVEVPLDGDLPRFLVGLNFTLALGRFSVDPDKGAVWFDHVLTADDLDDGTLSRTIAAVAGTADRYDDEIKSRFGGRTFREDGSPVAQATSGPGMAGGYL
jgi:hypothetical protein